MNKIVLFFIILVVTVLALVFNPQMHKAVKFEGADFSISTVKEDTLTNTTKKYKKINSPVKPVEQRQITYNQPQNNTQKKYTEVYNPVKKQKTENKKVNIVNNAPGKEVVVKKQYPQQETIELPKKQQTDEPKVSQTKLTPEQEEIIAWNKWRSNLQNKIMHDCENKLFSPIGTRYNFSFTLDRYGTVSNVKVSSSNPSYNALAVKVIKPLIISYQGQAIYNFPPKSKRVITNVTGGFYMSHTSRYSNESDYSDYERIK